MRQLFFLILVLLGACESREDSTSSTTKPVDDNSLKTSATTQKRQFSEGDLQVYRLRSSLDKPQHIVLDFGHEIFSNQSEVDENVEISLQPNIDGKLQRVDNSTLRFVPKSAFVPQQKYTLAITKLKIKDQSIDVKNQPTMWKHTFQSDPIAIEHVSLFSLKTKRQLAEFHFQFSVPPDVNAFKNALQMSQNGTPIVPQQVIASRNKHIVRVKTRLATIAKNSPVEVVLGKVASAVSAKHTSAAFRKTIKVQKPKELIFFGPYVKETSAGFMIEFICDDPMVSGYRPWHYDRQIRFDRKISSRCHIPSSRIKDHISVSPSVETKIINRTHGFALVGDFQRGSYRVLLKEGLMSLDGAVISRSLDQQAVIPKRSALLQFVAKGRYLSHRSWGTLAFRHRNINGVIKVKIKQVAKENLHFWLQQNSEQVDVNVGDIVYTEEIYVHSDKEQIKTQNLQLASKLKDHKNGLYEITLETSGKSDQLRVQVTNMNLVAKREQTEDKGILVWALDMESNEPLRDIQLDMIRPSGSIAQSCTTNGDGFCQFSGKQDKQGNDTDYAILASNGQHFSFLQLSDLEIPLNDFDVYGDDGATKKYRASIHSDRGAYRPGDNAHLYALLRGKLGVVPPTGLPVVMEIHDGRGRMVKKFDLQTNGAGVVEQSIELPYFASTGRWKASILVAGQQLDQYGFRVEDLVPERMKVSAAFGQSERLGGEKAEMTLSANYLFGSPASNAPYEVICRVEPGSFKPQQNSNYRFTADDTFDGFVLGTLKGRLDEQGKARISCPDMERTRKLPSMARVYADIDIFEAGSGRSTYVSIASKIHPAKYYLGLQTGAKDIRAGNSYAFSGIVVDWKGLPTKEINQIDVSFSQLETGYNWFLNEQTGKHRSESYLQELPIFKKKVKVKSGRFHFGISTVEDGEAFRVQAQSATLSTSYRLEGRRYYRYWSRRNQVVSTPSPVRPDVLAINTPKSIDLSESVEVSTIVPYRGRILWTVETDKVLRKEWVQVGKAGKASWTFNLKGEDFYPNVYVSALLFKDPHIESKTAFIPNRAFGVQSVRIQPKKYAHKLTIQAPKEIQANKKLAVDLDFGGKVEPDTVVMLAAVDEGLLSLTRFASPDPFPKLFPRQALQIQSHETVGWAVMLPSQGTASSMGGGASARSKRPDVVKPVAMWSGIKKVPQNGKLTVDFQVPQYSGKLRMMAVSASPSRIGRAEANVLVRDPLLLQATLPRFLTEGDRFQAPVFISNLSGKDQKINVRMYTKGDADVISFLGKDKTELLLKKGESKTIVFQAQAKAETGFATFIVEAKAGSLKSQQSFEVPFASQRPYERQTTKLVLPAGKELSLQPQFAEWLSEDSQVWATTNPYGRAMGHMSHLIRYPYGCLEQTTSALRPLISARDMIPHLDAKLVKNTNVDAMVAAGIERLASMQTYSGGFGYWPGSDTAHPWGTAYATDALLDAQKAGYPILPGMIESALSYMKRRIDYGSKRDTSLQNAKPYMYYTLAKAGKGKSASIRRTLRKMRRDTKTAVEDILLLQAALYMSGDRSYAKQLRNPVFPELDERGSPWRFWSTLRTRGMALAIHQDLFGTNDPRGEALATDLASRLEKPSRYYSTQELAWSFYALSSRVATQGDWSTPVLKIDGKTQKAGQESDKTGATWEVWDIAKNKQQLTVASTASRDLFLLVSSQGIKKKGAHQFGEQGVRVKREYFQADGKPFAAQSHKLGDVVYIRVTVENLKQQSQHELALVDRIPAGWEIEGVASRSSVHGKRFYTAPQWSADHYNLRDARVEVFGDLKAGKKRQFVYSVRAVTSGDFYIPPVDIEAMYDSTVWSRQSGGMLSIQGSWDDSLL